MMTIAVDIRSGDGNAMELLECVAFLLIRGNTVLAEKRKLTKKVVSGVIAMPGGHLEEGEPPEEALSRELCEELGIVPIDRYYVCTLLQRSQAFRKLHYFAIPPLSRGDDEARSRRIGVGPIRRVGNLRP
jgi:8-oxo-dGTP pyrophosphatase MutT (NUDIX family)